MSPDATTPTPAAASAGRAETAPSMEGAGTGIASLDQVIDELERMRNQAGDEIRSQLEPVVRRVQKVASDLRERTEAQASDVERAVERIADDAWRQIAILAVRAQHDADALSEISAEIRKRKAQLRPPAKRAAAKRTTSKTAPAKPAAA